MKFVLAKKLKMTQLPDPEMGFVPVTVLESDPAIISQIKTQEKDGYTSIQIAVNETKHLTKQRLGHLKKAFKDEEVKKLKNLKEFRIDDLKDYTIGDIIDLKQFSKGDIVDVQGISKGKGFQGTVKRWNFRGAPASHGTKHALREPGSIGAQGPQHVIKGHKMSGRMGADLLTVKNLKIVDIDLENNLLFITGAIPGRQGTLVKIWSK